MAFVTSLSPAGRRKANEESFSIPFDPSFSQATPLGADFPVRCRYQHIGTLGTEKLVMGQSHSDYIQPPRAWYDVGPIGFNAFRWSMRPQFLVERLYRRDAGQIRLSLNSVNAGDHSVWNHLHDRAAGLLG